MKGQTCHIGYNNVIIIPLTGVSTSAIEDEGSFLSLWVALIKRDDDDSFFENMSLLKQ